MLTRTLLSCTLILLLHVELGACGEGARQPLTEPEVVARCRSISAEKCYDIINTLAMKRDLAALKAIADADLPCSHWALLCYAEQLDSDNAIVLCTRQKLLSSSWVAAFSALASHEKQKVIGYIVQLSGSSDPYVRYYCYFVCKANRWPELTAMAGADLSSSVPLYLPGAKIGSTLGTMAHQYLTSIDPKLIQRYSKDTGKRQGGNGMNKDVGGKTIDK